MRKIYTVDSTFIIIIIAAGVRGQQGPLGLRVIPMFG